jgi:hypothetical protein
VWEEFSRSIRLLLDNKYIYQDFWNHRNGKLTEAEWQQNFADANKAAGRTLAQRETATVLSIVLTRLYTLRNQLMHGDATWNSSVNRDQVRDCANQLGKLVPLVIEIMMDNVNTLWGMRVTRSWIERPLACDHARYSRHQSGILSVMARNAQSLRGRHRRPCGGC